MLNIANHRIGIDDVFHMDIPAWSSLFRSDAKAAEAEFRRRLTSIPPDQQSTVWSSLSDQPWAPTAKRSAIAPLYGVPFAVKDLFPVRDHYTRAGSGFLRRKNRTDARLVSTLKAKGAINVGTTHLHEFGYGLTGENIHFGNVSHPSFPKRTTGGSSSGSAAVVAAGVVPFALGTDTGGSLRVPAAYCGIYSWRDMPRQPWITDAYPLAPSFDTAGWLTKTAADLRRLHSVLIVSESASTPACRGVYVSANSLGFPIADDFESSLGAKLEQLFGTRIQESKKLAARIRASSRAYAVLQSTEAFAIHQAQLDLKKESYSEMVWSRIDRGRSWTAQQFHAARLYHLGVKAAFDVVFRERDFVVMPVAPTPALVHGDCDQTNRDALLAFNTPVSLAGLPTITVPVPLPGGLSLGLQFIFSSRTSRAIPWILAQCEKWE